MKICRAWDMSSGLSACQVVFSSRAVSWETKGSKPQAPQSLASHKGPFSKVPVGEDVLGKEKLSRCRVYVEAMEHEVPTAGLYRAVIL